MISRKSAHIYILTRNGRPIPLHPGHKGIHLPRWHNCLVIFHLPFFQDFSVFSPKWLTLLVFTNFILFVYTSFYCWIYVSFPLWLLSCSESPAWSTDWKNIQVVLLFTFNFQIHLEFSMFYMWVRIWLSLFPTSYPSNLKQLLKFMYHLYFLSLWNSMYFERRQFPSHLMEEASVTTPLKLPTVPWHLGVGAVVVTGGPSLVSSSPLSTNT